MIGIEPKSVSGWIQLLIWLVLVPSSVSANCYYPNGRDTNVNSPLRYLPCEGGDRSDGQFTMCCADYDVCRPDGMCLSGYDSTIWRVGCTIPPGKVRVVSSCVTRKTVIRYLEMSSRTMNYADSLMTRFSANYNSLCQRKFLLWERVSR